MRSLQITLLVVVTACGNTKTVDRAYQAALEDRMKAICGCRELKEPDGIVACYQAAEREHPEPVAPGGRGAGIYRESLRDEDAASIERLDKDTISCDTEVFKYVTAYKESQSHTQRPDPAAERKALADQIGRSRH